VTRYELLSRAPRATTKNVVAWRAVHVPERFRAVAPSAVRFRDIPSHTLRPCLAMGGGMVAEANIDCPKIFGSRIARSREIFSSVISVISVRNLRVRSLGAAHDDVSGTKPGVGYNFAPFF
jgi:hypothetical protein